MLYLWTREIGRQTADKAGQITLQKSLLFRYLFEILENKKLIYSRLDVWVQYPVSPLSVKDKWRKSKSKSRKIKVLRDFLYLCLDKWKTWLACHRSQEHNNNQITFAGCTDGQKDYTLILYYEINRIVCCMLFVISCLGKSQPKQQSADLYRLPLCNECVKNEIYCALTLMGSVEVDDLNENTNK